MSLNTLDAAAGAMQAIDEVPEQAPPPPSASAQAPFPPPPPPHSPPPLQPQTTQSQPQLADASPERLIAALESKAPNLLVACKERLRSLLFKAEAYQAHVLQGICFGSWPHAKKRGEGGAKQGSMLIELPLPPSAPQKKGCSCIQRSMLPMRLSDQATALHMRLAQLKSAVADGRMDVKAFGVKADQDKNPAHVAALLRVCLALMGKDQFEDPVEHWLLLPRQNLISLYIEEYSGTMSEIIGMANEAALIGDNEQAPLAKYRQLEAQPYTASTSRERIGDRIVQKLNIVLVPMKDRHADPLSASEVKLFVMSNPVGMPADYLVRHVDMLFRNMAMTEREALGQMITGERETWELLRLTLPKDAIPMVEALICSYGGEEERSRLAITVRRRQNSFARVAAVKAQLHSLLKSSDVHVSMSKNKNTAAVRQQQVRAKAKNLSLWLDESESRRFAADHQIRYQDKQTAACIAPTSTIAPMQSDDDSDLHQAWDQDSVHDLHHPHMSQMSGASYASHQHQPPPPTPPPPMLSPHSVQGSHNMGTQHGCGLRLQDSSVQGMPALALGMPSIPLPPGQDQDPSFDMQQPPSPSPLLLPPQQPGSIHMGDGVAGTILNAEEGVQLSVKIYDHNSNGGTRYKGWAFHRQAVIKRLGWRLLHVGVDYATFLVPHALLAEADRERRARVPKEQRQYWSDKNDFCRCLEVIVDENMKKSNASMSVAEHRQRPKCGGKRHFDPMASNCDGFGNHMGMGKKSRILNDMETMAQEVGSLPPLLGICGGSAGSLGLSSTWQLARSLPHASRAPDSSE